MLLGTFDLGDALLTALAIFFIVIWIWIGGIAIISPIGLIALRRIYDSMKTEKAARET